MAGSFLFVENVWLRASPPGNAIGSAWAETFICCGWLSEPLLSTLQTVAVAVRSQSLSAFDCACCFRRSKCLLDDFLQDDIATCSYHSLSLEIKEIKICNKLNHQ